MQPRIVSLIASSTEIVHALGMIDFMVGRSHECDYPPEVKKLPQCTSPKFQTDGSSYEIDQRVKAIVQESLSVYKVDAELLEELQPTHIITQAQCEVCAVSLKDVEAAACETITSQPKIVSLEPNALADIFADIKKVGMALDISGRAAALTESLQARINTIREKAERLSTRPTVACIEWIDPLMAGGNWMPEIIELAGGRNLFGEAGKHSPWMTWEQLLDADPDLILVTPCGFDIARTMREMHIIAGKPKYADLNAVKNGRVFVADGNQFFNRPGPRVVEALEILAEIIHPAHFQFGHEHTGWINFRESLIS